MKQIKILQTKIWLSSALILFNTSMFVFLLRKYINELSSMKDLLVAGFGLLIVILVNVFLLKKGDEQYFEADLLKKKNQKIAASILIIIAIFVVNSFRYYDLFPLILVGEWNHILAMSTLLTDWAKQQHLARIFVTYNIGPGLIYAPLKPIIGESQSAIKTFVIVGWALMLAGLVWAFSYRHRNQWLVLLLTPALLSTITLISLRTYKWHSIAVMASVAIYLIVHQYQKTKQNHKKYNALVLVLGVLMLATSIIMYQTTIVYVPILALVFLLNHAIKQEFIFSRAHKAIMITLSVLFLCGITVFLNNPSAHDITIRIKQVFLHGGDGTTIQQNTYSFLKLFFMQGTSFPLSVTLLLGACVGIRDFLVDWFSRTTIIMFAVIASLLFITFGATNIDENNYLVIPLCAFMLIGIKELYLRSLLITKEKAWTTSALLALAIMASIMEANYYFYGKNLFPNADGKISPPDNNTAALILADIANKQKQIDNLVVFFPKTQTPESVGGFDTYDFYYTPFFKETLSNVVEYDSIDEIVSQIKTIQKNEPQKIVLLYYNNDDPELEKKLLSKTSIINPLFVSAPYPNVWVNKSTLKYIVYISELNKKQLPAAINADMQRAHKNIYIEQTMARRVEELADIVRGEALLIKR